MRLLAFGLVLIVLLAASTVILLVDFRLKENRTASSRAASVSTPSPLFPQVDGQISRGEYDYLYRDPNGLTLYWKIDQTQKLIYLGLRSPVAGRVSISLEPTGPGMKGGDLLIGFVKDGQVEALDGYADKATGYTPDIELAGGRNDILAKAGSSRPEGTILELVRKLDTGDPFDKPIVSGKMRVQLGFSEITNFVGLYGDKWITLEVEFFTGLAQPTSLP